MLKNDLKNDIEKTLQAHCPEPPEGFAERMDNKAISLMQKKQERNVIKGKPRFRLPVLVAAAVLALCIMTAATRELIIRPDAIRARETATPLVTALSEGHGEATGSAALSEDAVMLLEDEYPGLFNELKPVNLSSEQQGVRFDLISALIKDQELYILYSIQDLEGERVGSGTITFYDDSFSSGDRNQSTLKLSYDETEHKGTYLRKCELDRPARAAEQVMMSFRDLGLSEILYVDLNPLLDQYGETADGVTLPEDITVTSDNPDFISDVHNKVVLDYTQPLDEPLWGALRLTGIGWIDNRLHMQIHNPDVPVITIGRNEFSSWMIVPAAVITDGEDSRDVGFNTLSWGYTEEKVPTWQEYVWEMTPDEKDRLNLSAYVTRKTKTLDAKWEFKVPVDTILAENSTETAAPAAEAFPDNPVLLTEEAILREVMDAHVEDISYDDLRPIGLSTEKQGIRMNVVSGCRKGNKAYFLLITQDLNGKYNEYECHPTFAYEHENDGWDGYEVRLNINRDEGKTTWLYRMDLSKVLLTENSTIRTGMKQLSFSERKEMDLLPMLKEYGRTEEGVTPPKESPRFTLDGKPMENKLKALKYDESLDIHLNGNVFLSAIGWIDDQLHVQFQNKSWAMMAEYPDVPYDSYMIIANCHVEDKAYEEIKVDSSPMSWLNADGTSWDEYVFNCMPEDLDRMKLYATGTVFKATLEDDWTVEVPMYMLPDLNAAAEPAAQEEVKTELAAPETEKAELATLSNKEEVYLAYAYPGLREELKPVNMSCEKQGIRAEVIYALIKDQKLYVVYSLQDLEGDRIKDNLNTYTYYLDNLGGTGLYSMRLGQDETEERKATFLKVYDIPDPVQTDGKLAVNLIGLMTEEYTTIDLLPLLKKYGKTVEGIDKPEDILAETMDWSAMSFSNVDLSKYPTILDYSQPLDVTLEGPVSLTGIGWIDNKLHVQIYNPDETTVTVGDTTYPSWMGSSRLAITDREDSRNPEYDILSWDAPSGRQMARKKYAEYVWEITPDDMDHLELKADIYHYQKISDTTWEIEIPIASILEETDTDTAVPEDAAADIRNESDEQIKGTLWAFFTSWVGQDAGDLLLVCADEWKNARPDPEQAARELMKSGRPGGYYINGISGKDNDPVRTADLTVLWGTEDGSFTGSRHEIAFRLQQITPAMEAYRVDPDGFGNRTAAEPSWGNELILLDEEEIIRKQSGFAFPELSGDDLISIGLSTEKQGIRLDMVSGCVKGQDLYLLCSVRDLEGRYDGLDMEIDQQWDKAGYIPLEYSRPFSDFGENKSIWVLHIEQYAQYQTEDGTIALGIDRISFEKDDSFDLLPFLKEYGKETAGVEPPDNARLWSNGEYTSAEGLKILDYTHPLDVSLTETAKLTGAGWIDNQLHVQLNTAAKTIRTESGISSSAVLVQVYDPFSSQSSRSVEWDDSGDSFPDWFEYVLDIKPEDNEQRWLTVEVRNIRGVVEDNWEIEIPVNMLLKETAEETAKQDTMNTIQNVRISENAADD